MSVNAIQRSPLSIQLAGSSWFIKRSLSMGSLNSLRCEKQNLFINSLPSYGIPLRDLKQGSIPWSNLYTIVPAFMNSLANSPIPPILEGDRYVFTLSMFG